jgi:hypothetical protein
MVKLLVFAILLASSPATGLIEKLFQAESACYTNCQTNYAANSIYLDACKQGCDYQTLNGGDCANQCIKYSTDEQARSSCQVGCTIGSTPTDEASPVKETPVAGPIPKIEEQPIIIPQNIGDQERPRSIILIRLRQRPSFDMPPPDQLFGKDPVEFFNNIMKQFQERANTIEQSFRQAIGPNGKDLVKVPELGSISELTKNIPLIRLPGNVRADSSSESSEETNEKRPIIGGVKHFFNHPRESVQPMRNRVHQFFADIRSEWNDLVRKQPKIPIWIFLGILLASSAILWYMVMSLCRNTPSRNTLSIRAQELIFNPYEGDAYEKEKIQPDDHPYEVTEPLPIKVKLSNI